MPLWYDLFPTAWGWVAGVVSEGGVRALSLPRPTPAEAWAQVLPWAEGAQPNASALAVVRERIQAYLQGHPVALEDIPVDSEGAPPFFRRVWEMCRSIPRGQVRTYKWLAEAVGHPRAVRGVGQAMARNRVPLVVPCHRVVGSDGGLHGYAGGVGMKARLLALEGMKWSGQ
ncbi:MAG: methylated-DNA--[protein]-cysteine S-methyltransferase [Dehalococcoidia bacterium]|nr:methylated-DNA--[protein]-cysteine S-methyltransferase [Dehalococcoidia bacterium]MDW8120102.1 methylated-DNA--[protein]-cysteine S-methyltransferase [Chloroflexota bacterium]